MSTQLSLHYLPVVYKEDPTSFSCYLRGQVEFFLLRRLLPTQTHFIFLPLHSEQFFWDGNVSELAFFSFFLWSHFLDDISSLMTHNTMYLTMLTEFLFLNSFKRIYFIHLKGRKREEWNDGGREKEREREEEKGEYIFIHYFMPQLATMATVWD